MTIDMTIIYTQARDQLAAKLKEREAQLTALKHQQDDNRRLAKDKEAGDKRTRTLESEVHWSVM